MVCLFFNVASPDLSDSKVLPEWNVLSIGNNCGGREGHPVTLRIVPSVSSGSLLKTEDTQPSTGAYNSEPTC
jgi:hypothetical protein